MRRALLLLLGTAALAGCPSTAPGAPVLHGLSPGATTKGHPVLVTVTGENLFARVRAELDAPSSSLVQLPTLTFVGADREVPAPLLTLRSSRELVLEAPGSMEPGRWSLRLVDAWGRRAALEDAFEVLPCAGAADCDDGVPCTTDACDAGQCVHVLSPGACLIQQVCVAAGSLAPGNTCLVCDPGSATLDWTPVPAGSACSDGNLCTVDDRCEAGVCTGTPKACDPGVPCEVGWCDPPTGACSFSPAPEGSACEDGYACTTGGVCQAGACEGVLVCANTPPRGCVKATPVALVTGGTATFDAGCTHDLESPLADLRFRFDFDGDGVWDTPFDASPTQTWTYAQGGLHVGWVEAQDPDGLSGFARVHVSVESGEGDVVVTTGEDESDLGATPEMPGGTGLSLREAIRHANDTPGVTRIRFDGQLEVRAAALPPLTRDGVRIVGGPDIRLGFSASPTDTCVTLAGTGQALIGLDIAGCRGRVLDTLGADIFIVDTRMEGGHPDSEGVRMRGPRTRLGPGVELSGFGDDSALDLRGPESVVIGAHIHHSRSGLRIFPQATDVQVVQAIIHGHAEMGVDVRAPASITASTIAWNGGPGIEVSGAAPLLTLRATLLTHNGGAGLSAQASAIVARSHNGYFGNAGPAVSFGTPDATDLVADPLYMGETISDFRLRPGSPAVNAGAGFVPGIDLNGPAPGTFHGAAPDLGAWESPW